MSKFALVAVDPANENGRAFARFTAVIRMFQEQGFLGRAGVLSLVHPDLYVYPYSWYRQRKRHFAKEALAKVTALCAGAFDFGSVKALALDSSAKETLVAKACRYARQQGNDLLVFSSSDRSGIPHWFLGSVSETAALTATLPLLIIKPQMRESDFSREPRIVVGIDASSPPDAAAVRWIAAFAKSAKAHVDLVYVEAKFRPGIDALNWRKAKAEAAKVLDGLQAKLRATGVRASVQILEESKSMAQALVDFADERAAWITLTVSRSRSMARRLLLGSTSRQALTLTKRPFLSLRLDG
jgi:nucleotide-binding universal stress UspA family protein